MPNIINSTAIVHKPTYGDLSAGELFRFKGNPRGFCFIKLSPIGGEELYASLRDGSKWIEHSVDIDKKEIIRLKQTEVWYVTDEQ